MKDEVDLMGSRHDDENSTTFTAGGISTIYYGVSTQFGQRSNGLNRN